MPANSEIAIQFHSLKHIKHKIHIIRGHRVMLSTDLAALYGVQPKVLIQAVKRNIKRFPDDFMYQLTRKEVTNLKSQIVTSSWGGLRRAMPYVFTEQGVAMLSSVLHSEQSIQVNIAIMRAFVRLRETLAGHKELAYQLGRLEEKVEKHDKEIQAVFEAIRQLMKPAPKTSRKIGFH